MVQLGTITETQTDQVFKASARLFNQTGLVPLLREAVKASAEDFGVESLGLVYATDQESIALELGDAGVEDRVLAGGSDLIEGLGNVAADIEVEGVTYRMLPIRDERGQLLGAFAVRAGRIFDDWLERVAVVVGARA